MSNLLNGMLKIWQGLPDRSKEAIVDNLSVKQRNLIQMGSQLMKYYAETAAYQGHEDQSTANQVHGAHVSSKKQADDDDDIIDVEWTEKK